MFFYTPALLFNASRMEDIMKKIEQLLELGGTRRDIAFLILSALSLLSSIAGFRPFSFDMAWIAVILCGDRKSVV